jgi:putative hydrolase of the HAD superfamily
MRAVLFDLGETLIHFDGLPLSWEPFYGAALDNMAAALGRILTETERERGHALLRAANTRRFPRTEEIPFAAILDPLLHGWNADTARAEDAFFAVFQRRVVLFDDAQPALRRLRNAGIATGILTDVPYGQPRRLVARDLGVLADEVPVWQTSGDIGWRKPDPRGFLRLAALLEIPPSGIACVGNEPKDVAAARAAGMEAILIDRDGTLPDLGEHRRIASLDAL